MIRIPAVLLLRRCACNFELLNLWLYCVLVFLVSMMTLLEMLRYCVFRMKNKTYSVCFNAHIKVQLKCTFALLSFHAVGRLWQVPFQRLCKGDDCVADLHMDFDFT